MSAVYGILHKYEYPAIADQLQQIRARLIHRITDGEGSWHDPGAGLGFCRLNLYREQEAKQLPFESGNLVIVADCRLDNRETLIKQLGTGVKENLQFTDAAIILLAYRKWGKRCPEYLDGEFAFVILDKETRELFAATDPVGHRPFFYFTGTDRFVFCSEIKGVLAVMQQPVFDEEHLINSHFLRGKQEHTYVKEIRALCGGKTLLFSQGICTVQTYWQLTARNKYRFSKDDEWITQLRTLLIRSVEKRISDAGNTGISLSGGLDSGTIAGILAQALAAKNKPLYTFTSVLPAGYQGIESDERYYIGEMTRMYPNIISTFVDAGDTGPFDPAGNAFAADENIPNAYFYLEQALLTAAKENGVRTFFTGLGGDSAVSAPKCGVYPLISKGAFPAALRIVKSLSVYDNISLFNTIKHEYLSRTPLWNTARSFVRKPQHPAVSSHFKPAFLKEYLPRLTDRPERHPNENLIKNTNSGKFGRITGALANRNAWYGITTCDPFFDRDLLEFMTDAPVHLYTAHGQRRGFIRAAIEGIVPPEIRWRRDKLPYGPDMIRRARNKAGIMAAELSSSRYDFIFERFFSRESVLNGLQLLEPFAGFRSATSVQSIRTLQATLSAQVLAHLEEQGFSF
ncbi:asparagine synthase-related protein [Sediminibacterium ginsengisoli]|uniref:asparagine synthase (glutamine-hydrolyzing) n=1 Tax=Sediminibacterium ginsengisoli TaxID=413434 RepID=A0A1T4P8D9_9BACT|nr:asparagine synthase-related protein [Sediminibacterium ginsengisoli]SJZ87577.1 asparagine synthase (glutamine-hydrolysing) [Sediminibacterium ginsengisoli]